MAERPPSECSAGGYHAGMVYEKYRWDDSRGDEHDDWGCCWFYFEFGEDDYAVRQMELYDSGVRLRYGLEHVEDEFGGLSLGRRSDMEAPVPEVLTPAEFERVWNAGPWHNQPPA